MTKKAFADRCASVERLGFRLVECQPFQKYAKYVKDDVVHVIGKPSKQ